MIDTAVNAIAKDKVEHFKDVAHDALDDLSDRIRDVDLAQHLGRTKKKKSHRGMRALFLLLALAGGAALVVYLQRRATEGLPQVAPDPFGDAVEREREAAGEPL